MAGMAVLSRKGKKVSSASSQRVTCRGSAKRWIDGAAQKASPHAARLPESRIQKPESRLWRRWSGQRGFCRDEQAEEESGEKAAEVR
jgi:hypothetical protein